jgi:2-dehydro-3-deoxy-D-arabinonate dehydratase
MRYYRAEIEGSPHLVARDGAELFDLTSVRPGLSGFAALAAAADVAGMEIDAVARRLLEEATQVSMPEEEQLAVPVQAAEVWAAGVTYEISEQAREAESGLPEMYLDVYDADRPEIFLKATPNRLVGPGAAVGIRGDSEWNVPEPELGIVLHRSKIVGYTIGNDVSSRSIEGENPLYLPQAKTYARSCAIGPCVATPETIGDPHDLSMSMEIVGPEGSRFEATTSTAEMKRSCEELVSYLTRHNTIPETTVLLTGTSLVPEEGFTLSPADRTTIEIESIGQLSNPTTLV